jgi:hypothetical protein
MMPMMPMMPMARQYQISEKVQALYFEKNGTSNGYWNDARILSRVEGRPDTYEIAWDRYTTDTIKHETQLRPTSEWSTGICDCSSEPDRSALAFACPCIMFGFMSEMLPAVSICDAGGKQLCIYAV